MRKKLYLISIACLLTCFYSTSLGQLRSLNNQVESIIRQNPDSIEFVIIEIESLLPEIVSSIETESSNSQEINRTFQLFSDLQTILYFAKEYDNLLNLINPVLSTYDMTPNLSQNMGLEKSLYYLANTYLRKANYDSAEYYYRLVIPLQEEIKDTTLLIRSYGNLANSLKEKEEYQLAIYFYEKSKRLREINSPETLPTLYNNVATAYLELGDLESAYSYLADCLNISPDSIALHYAHNNLGRYYELKGSNGENPGFHKKAIKHHFTSLKIRERLNDQKKVFNSYLNLGVNYSFLGKYDTAIHFFEKAQLIESSFHSPKERVLLQEDIAEVYYGKRRFGKAIDILQNTIDHVKNEHYGPLNPKDKLISLGELKKNIEAYKVGKIERQQFILIICFLLICAILALLYQHEQSKKEKIEIEKLDIIDKHTVELANKGIETREEIYKHIGQELHDEIQNFIFAMKLGLREEKDATTIENLNELNKKVRRIAQGMKLEKMENGLPFALMELCDQFNRKNSCKVELLTTKVERRRFNHKVEQNIYRIVQEALTNTVKHAKAKNVYIQLLHFENEKEILRLSIEDDGNGFDMQKLKPSIGLRGMQERAEGLGGTFQIDSRPDSGTIIMVEIPAEVKGIEGKGEGKS